MPLELLINTLFEPYMHFDEADYRILRKALNRLRERDAEIIFLRFWHEQAIEEIAGAMRMSWDQVDLRIERSLERLKEICLSDPYFSRSPLPIPSDAKVSAR